ncbi:acyl-CoA carboxylase subunit epsilon [Gordonia sp. X0973]|uniref:acyl-CoA carboxylase epsilon subunit n=1 Tax=Gordonia sp. X0973 TaxID=2742602 RepID=UPI000F54254A|nr:acyl-CoA carboxylase epsilon subunit [Gordonia sp. X0973]QKT06783.1 acyl-CoA carboxylase subunit epsilon [Gordonia sp. X0973]
MTGRDGDAEKGTGADATKAPLLRVVKGNPTPAQVAAITAVVVAKAAESGGETAAEPGNEWGRPVDRMRPHWGSPTGFYKQLW